MVSDPFGYGCFERATSSEGAPCAARGCFATPKVAA
jgi:hypothetical protein